MRIGAESKLIKNMKNKFLFLLLMAILLLLSATICFDYVVVIFRITLFCLSLFFFVAFASEVANIIKEWKRKTKQKK